MWGGSLPPAPAAIMQEINASIGVDKRLYPEDIPGLAGPCRDAGETGHHLGDGRRRHRQGPRGQLKAEIEAGNFEFKVALEDIHMNVEQRPEGR